MRRDCKIVKLRDKIKAGIGKYMDEKLGQIAACVEDPKDKGDIGLLILISE